MPQYLLPPLLRCKCFECPYSHHSNHSTQRPINSAMATQRQPDFETSLQPIVHPSEKRSGDLSKLKFQSSPNGSESTVNDAEGECAPFSDSDIH